jgi:hypothetical protein
VVAIQGHYGHNLPAKQPHNMPKPDPESAKILIDERIVAALDKRKPIGMSRTAWVNYLLQFALGQHPEILDVRGVTPNG